MAENSKATLPFLPVRFAQGWVAVLLDGSAYCMTSRFSLRKSGWAKPDQPDCLLRPCIVLEILLYKSFTLVKQKLRYQ